MKKNLHKKRSAEKLAKNNETINSFLVETSFNSDIDVEIRKEIEKKYLKSRMNSEYIFPRTPVEKMVVSRHVSSKSSFESLRKLEPIHKITKSTASGYNELKLNDKLILKKKARGSKLTPTKKSESKKDLQKAKSSVLKCDHFERFKESRSPKLALKNSELIKKPGCLTSKKSQVLMTINKLFTPSGLSLKVSNPSTSRLKRILTHPKTSAK